MAKHSTCILAVLLLALGAIKCVKTSARMNVNITIYRAPLYDSLNFGFSSKHIQCCETTFDSRCCCNRTNSAFFEGNWSCVNTERLGNMEGCHYLPAKDIESSSNSVTTWASDVARVDRHASTECKFNITGKLHNRYLDCHGEWINVAAEHIESIFNLTTQYQKKVHLKPKYSSSASVSGEYGYLFGRLMKLEVQCKTSGVLQSKPYCVLVKTIGTQLCTVPKSKITKMKTEYLPQALKGFQKVARTEENASTKAETPGVLVLLIEAVIVLIIISVIIFTCTFRPARNHPNIKIPGRPSYFKRKKSKSSDSCKKMKKDSSDPVEVLSKTNDGGSSYVKQMAKRLDSISNPAYDKGPDKKDIFRVRGDVTGLLRKVQLPRPKKRRFTQPPLSNFKTAHNASRGKPPHSVHSTILEEQEGMGDGVGVREVVGENYQDRIYEEVYNKSQKKNLPKLRYSNPFPTGGQPRTFHESPEQMQIEPLHYYYKTIVHDSSSQALHIASGQQNKSVEADSNIQQRIKASLVNTQECVYSNPENLNKQGSLSPNCDDGAISVDPANGENIYAVLCCENPNECCCDEGYGSQMYGNATFLQGIHSFDV